MVMGSCTARIISTKPRHLFQNYPTYFSEPRRYRSSSAHFKPSNNKPHLTTHGKSGTVNGYPYPLTFQKTLENQFKGLLADCHTGKRGSRYAKNRKANPEMTFWEVGNSLPKFQMEHKLKGTDMPSGKSDKK